MYTDVSDVSVIAWMFYSGSRDTVYGAGTDCILVSIVEWARHGSILDTISTVP